MSTKNFYQSAYDRVAKREFYKNPMRFEPQTRSEKSVLVQRPYDNGIRTSDPWNFKAFIASDQKHQSVEMV